MIPMFQPHPEPMLDEELRKDVAQLGAEDRRKVAAKLLRWASHLLQGADSMESPGPSGPRIEFN